METTASLVTVPLGQSAHQLAENFLSKQPKHRAKQVYLNTLAVYAVRFYLECMQIKTNWEDCDSYDPVMQILMDVADLEVHNLGKLECRPVLPGTNSVQIPQEVWSDRIGYVAVQFDESLEKATLLGFVEAVSVKELPINNLREMEDLFTHLDCLMHPNPIKLQVNLSLWLKNVFEPGWLSIQEIFSTDQENLVFGFRTAFEPSRGVSSSRVNIVKRAKLINLGLQIEDNFLALVVAIAPNKLQGMNILVQLRPPFGRHLPPSTTLALLLESGEILGQAQARDADSCIQLDFRGQPGEYFNIKVASGEVSMMQSFVI